MESDWKKFCAIVPELRERYVAEQNAAVLRLLTDPTQTDTARFWAALKLMTKEAKTLRQCLDGHSRSKMWLYMLSMRAAGMLKQEDLAGFSEELRNQMFPEPSGK